MNKENKANYWVIGYGCDCDGAEAFKLDAFNNLEQANKWAQRQNEWSDGVTYSVTENWSEVVDYCDYWQRDASKYTTYNSKYYSQN